MPPEPWYTKRQIAEELQISVRTVERLKLPFTRVGRQNRYRMSQVERALAGGDDRGDNVIPIRPQRPKRSA